jgi:hypothetical protein
MKVWQGNSLINGEPIMVCLSGLKTPSSNRKTGPMVHAWIVPVAEPMQVAVKSGLDASVCGSCRRRRSIRDPTLDDTPRRRWEVSCPGRCSDCMVCAPGGRPQGIVVDAHGTNGHRNACYVIPWQVPKLMHELYAKVQVAGFVTARAAINSCERHVRLGAVGDPAAVPIHVWKYTIPIGLWGPAYTQRWMELPGDEWRHMAMASVDTVAEAEVARSMGWRTFRVRTPREATQ